MEDQKPDVADSSNVGDKKSNITAKIVDKLNAAGWGLLFIWIGIALLLELSSSIILLGIGTVILLVQVICKYLSLSVRLFYVFVGLLFMIGGFWKNYKPEVPLIPVFLIVVGTGLLLSFIKHIIKQ